MTTTEQTAAPGDARAERIRASADMIGARAQAHAVLAETNARIAHAAAAAADSRRERDAARRREEREGRRARKAARRAGRRDRWAARRADAAERAPQLVRVAACTAPTVIGMTGQFAFGAGPMRLGPLAFLVPLMFEGAAWVLAWAREQAIRASKPDALLGRSMWVIALLGAGMNFWHGSTTSPQVGAMYAAASLLGFWLADVFARAHRAARRTGVRPRVGVLRGLRYPGLAFAAWSLQVEMGHGADPAEAWRQVWQNRYDTAPGATRAERKDGRARVRGRDRDRRARTRRGRDLAAVRAEVACLRGALTLAGVAAVMRAEDLGRDVAAQAEAFTQERAALTAERESADQRARDAERRAREALAEAERARAESAAADAAREAAEREAREAREAVAGPQQTPVAGALTPADPADERPRTKRELIDPLIFAAWDRGAEPNCAEIDRETGGEGTGTARQRKRDLVKAGWGPGNVPAEYRSGRRLHRAS